MKTYQDIQVDDPVRVRDRLTGATSLGAVAETPTNLQADIFVRFSDDIMREFKAVDVIPAGEYFPPRPNYDDLAVDSLIHWQDDDGTIITGAIANTPTSALTGEVEAYRVGGIYSEMVSIGHLVDYVPPGYDFLLSPVTNDYLLSPITGEPLTKAA